SNVGIGTSSPATALSVVGTSTLQNAQITNALLLAPVILKRGDGTLTMFGQSATTATQRGTALDSALAAAISGDAIILGPATFSRTTGTFTVGSGVTVQGSGKEATIVTKTG